jgi:hypothetical protein
MTTQTRSAAWGTHLILTAIILVATFLPLTFINFEKIHPAEDAAMLMRYAVHLAEGYGIVWNKGEKPVDGATDFLFMVMTALLIKSGLTPEVAIRSLIFTAHLMSVLLIYLAGVLIFRVDHRIAFLASLLLVTSNGMFYVATCFGAPVFALFASAAWLCVMRMILVQSEWSWAVGYGFFSLLTGMTRPEGVILTFLMLIGLVIARGWRNALTPAIAWFAFVVGLGGLYFLWRWDYFGHPIAKPILQKRRWNFALGRIAKLCAEFYRIEPPLHCSVANRDVDRAYFARPVRDDNSHSWFRICVYIALPRNEYTSEIPICHSSADDYREFPCIPSDSRLCPNHTQEFVCRRATWLRRSFAAAITHTISWLWRYTPNTSWTRWSL